MEQNKARTEHLFKLLDMHPGLKSHMDFLREVSDRSYRLDWIENLRLIMGQPKYDAAEKFGNRVVLDIPYLGKNGRSIKYSYLKNSLLRQPQTVTELIDLVRAVALSSRIMTEMPGFKEVNPELFKGHRKWLKNTRSVLLILHRLKWEPRFLPPEKSLSSAELKLLIHKWLPETDPLRGKNNLK